MSTIGVVETSSTGVEGVGRDWAGVVVLRGRLVVVLRGRLVVLRGALEVFGEGVRW